MCKHLNLSPDGCVQTKPGLMVSFLFLFLLGMDGKADFSTQQLSG